MARAARPRQPVQRPAGDVTVPPEFVVGPLAEVWSDSGRPDDLGSAFQRHARARRAWQEAAHLTTADACALAPVRGPWALASPDGPDRLARLGFTADDLPRLRRAAGLHDTNSPRRATP